jgi:hypothetical protein
MKNVAGRENRGLSGDGVIGAEEQQRDREASGAQSVSALGFRRAYSNHGVASALGVGSTRLA